MPRRAGCPSPDHGGEAHATQDRRAVGRRPLRAHLSAEERVGLRDAEAVADLFLNMFRRDLLTFLPQSQFEPVADAPEPRLRLGPEFRLVEGPPEGEDRVEIYGVGHRLASRDGRRFSAT